MRDNGGELFIECRGYLNMIGEMTIVESDGLVRSLGGLLPRESSKKGPEI